MIPPSSADEQHLPTLDWSAYARAPWRQSLFALLRRVDARSDAPAALGRTLRPAEEPVRLCQPALLTFAAGELAAITPPAQGLPAQISLRNFGLLGPNGPLPLAFTEYAWQRQHQHNDPCLTAFINLLQHRLMTLFYRAWANGQPCCSADRGDDRRFEQFIASLAGTRWAHRGQRDRAVCYLAGHLSRHPRSADGLCQLLEYLLQRPVTLLANQFHWLPIAHDQRLYLGGPARSDSVGGFGCLGNAMADRQTSFTLRIGPLPWADYRQFLPPAAGNPPGEVLGLLMQWVRGYAGPEYRWSLEPALAADAYRSCLLDGHFALGHACWLGHNPQQAARHDLRYCPDTAQDEE